MKAFQKIFLTFLLSSGCLFIACDSEIDCSCPPITGEYFDVKGLDVIPRGNGTAALAAGTELRFEDFAYFHLDYEVDYVAFESRKKHFLGMQNAAWACSCIFDGYSGAKDEGIADLTITTLNDYNESIKAGDSLNELLLVQTNTPEKNLTDYVIESEGQLIPEENLYLYLSSPPTENKEVRLNVRVELTNGEVYEVKTEPIIFN